MNRISYARAAVMLATSTAVLVAAVATALPQLHASAASVTALTTGEIERLTLNNPNDVWSGGTMVVGGQNVIIPRNLLMDLPANRLSLQQAFMSAPPACLARSESGLAKADACNTSGTGAIATVAANRLDSGEVIAGDVFIQKGIELVTGVVTFIDFTDGYFRVNGVAGDPKLGVMVRLNDPGQRHTIQQGLGCAGGPNCSPDPRFNLDPDNYTSSFSTGYPLCIPSTVARTFVDVLDLNGTGKTTGTLTAQAKADGSGDVLCPLANRTAAIADDSRRMAPIQTGDHVMVQGNFETIGSVRFLSVWHTRVSRALTTKNQPGQPDYVLIDNMFADAPGFQRNRIRDQFIGYATAASPDVLLWSIHHDPSTNAPHEFPLASVIGCEIIGGPTTCIGVNGPHSFRIRHDVLFSGGVAKKGKLDPCAQLQADFRFATQNPCPQGGTLAEQFSIMSPIYHELQARTGLKMADLTRTGGPILRSIDIRGLDSPNGQYVFPMGIGLGGIEMPAFLEINIDKLNTPYSFDGIPWNLDRRLSPGGCVGPCESTPQPLDPFPVSGFDPRIQAQTPTGPESDPLYTHSTLSVANNRVLSFVDAAVANFDGDRTVLAWPPLAPTGAGVSATPPLTVNNPPALITGVTPAGGAPGITVIIDGTGLVGVTGVTFGGVPATTFKSLSSTQISAVVPVGAGSGPVGVTLASGPVSSLIRYVVTPPPALKSFSPTSGPVSTGVTITGQWLASTTDVTFNGVSAPFTVVSDTVVRATVPGGATSGTIKVTTVGGAATSAATFSVSPTPTISSVTPPNGPPGTRVLIAGAGLAGATAVSFGGVPATSFNTISDAQISAIVPTGALSGPVSVDLASGPVASGPSYTLSRPVPTQPGTSFSVSVSPTPTAIPTSIPTPIPTPATVVTSAPPRPSPTPQSTSVPEVATPTAVPTAQPVATAQSRANQVVNASAPLRNAPVVVVPSASASTAPLVQGNDNLASAQSVPVAAVSLPTPPQAVSPGTAEAITFIDPEFGGQLTMVEDNCIFAVTVPPGASPDGLVLALGPDPVAGNVRLGHDQFRLTATNSDGQLVTAFDQPLELTIRLSPDELQSISDDLMALVVSVADPATGVFADLPTTVQPDGAVTLSLDHFGAAEPSPDLVLPSDPGVDAQ